MILYWILVAVLVLANVINRVVAYRWRKREE